jgi:aminopeptidase C
MTFKKGRTKTGGRESGTKNKISGNILDSIMEVLETNKDEFKKQLKKLSPNEFVKAYISMSKMVAPKSITHSFDNEPYYNKPFNKWTKEDEIECLRVLGKSDEEIELYFNPPEIDYEEIIEDIQRKQRAILGSD